MPATDAVAPDGASDVAGSETTPPAVVGRLGDAVQRVRDDIGRPRDEASGATTRQACPTGSRSRSTKRHAQPPRRDLVQPPLEILYSCSNWIPYGFQLDVMKNSDLTVEPRQRTGETEKMTVNVGVVDLGHVDLLVQEGFYSNRSDLMRTALRNQLALHADMVKQTVARRTLTVGLQHYGRADLEKVVAAGQRLQVQVVGLARIADDVTPELARDAIESVTVLGAFQASPAVRRALSDRIH